MTDFFFRRNDIFPVGTSVGAYDGLDVIAPEGRPPPAGLIDTEPMTSEGLTFSGLEESGRYWAVGEVDSEYRWMGFWTAPSQDPTLLDLQTQIATKQDESTAATDAELAAAEAEATADLASHASETTGIHGITDTSDLALKFQLPINVLDHGATGDGSTDDTAAVEAAVAAAEVDGGIVFLPAGRYAISSQIEIPNTVVVQGVGAAWGGTPNGSSFLCTDADSGLLFTGNTAVHQGFWIDGNEVATNPMRVDQSFGLTFIGVTVQGALEDNIFLFDAQQATFYSCTSHGAGRDGLVLDGSTLACLFSRWESNNNGRHGLLISDTAGVYTIGPSGNRFDHSLFECQSAGISTDEQVKITRCGESGAVTLFDSCTFVVSETDLAATGVPVVNLTEYTSFGLNLVEFRSCTVTNNSLDTVFRVGFNVDIDDNQMGVVISGMTQCSTGGGAGSAVVKASAADTLRLYGSIRDNAAGPVISPTSAAVRVNADIEYPSTDRDEVAGALVADASRAIVTPAVKATGGTQAITTSTPTAVDLSGGEYLDTNSMHEGVTHPTRVTCNTAGLYQIEFTCTWAASATGSVREVQIRLNGSGVLGKKQQAPVAGGFLTGQSVSALYPLIVGDYVEGVVFQDSGGDLNVTADGTYSPSLTAVRVADG